MIRHFNERGQMAVPMIAAFLLAGIFWMEYMKWTQTLYWTMRMDTAADLTALSAARMQAEQLNYMGTVQWLENAPMQKAKIFGPEVAHMQIAARSTFDALNALLQLQDTLFIPNVVAIAQKIAKDNGATKPAVPVSSLGHRLVPKRVHVVYCYGLFPVGYKRYDKAFFARGGDWAPRTDRPQPPHTDDWVVCRGTVCQEGRARLWLDVQPNALLNNGGFPKENESLLGGIGIQGFYPQFGAQLLPKR